MASCNLVIVTQGLAKSAYEAAATPAIYAVVYFLKRGDRVGVYDTDRRFSPLALFD